MPDFAEYVIADETVMDMNFGKIVLKCRGENVDLSRLGSRGGMPYLAGHDSEMPLGRFETMEVKNGRVEGSAQIIPTDRNEPYVQEVKAGVRPGCSPAFLLDFDKIQALEDLDNPDGFIGVIMKWHIYEASAVTTPRNQNAGLLGVRNRSGSRASIARAEEVTEDQSAEIQEKVDAEVSAQVAAWEKKIAETGTVLEAGTKRQEKLKMELFSQVKNKNGQAEPGTTAAMKYKAVFASMLFGGPDPEASDVVLDYVGQTGKMGTVKLRVDTEMAAAFDTTNAHGAVTTMGGAMVADAYYETSPMRILSLPRRLENLEADLQVPTLTQEPNSAMVAQGAARLAVVDGVLASAPPTLSPKRLQTVVDYSMQETLVGPGFEDFIMDVIMAASDRHLAEQILRGDGMGQNLRGIVNTTGILETEYMAADKGGQSGFFDCEDSLAVDVPADRRMWVVSEDLFRKARRTLRDPGDATYVLRRWDGRTRILDGAEAIRTNTLTAGYGVYGEWSACTLGLWENALVTIDRITQPGLLKVTVDRYFDFAVTRAARFSVLKAA